MRKGPSGGSNSCVQTEMDKRGSDDLKAISHPAKFPTCEKELKKTLKLGVVVYTFNVSTQKAEASGSLSLRPSLSTKQVPGRKV